MSSVVRARRAASNLSISGAAATGGVVAAILLLVWSAGGSWFASDDFTNVGVSREMPFGWDYLERSVYGHFLPGYRLEFRVYDVVFGGSFWGVTVYQCVGLAGCGYLLWKLGRLINASREATAVAVVIFSFSFFLVPSEAWMSAALNVWPANLAVLGVLICHISFVRRGAVWTAILGVGVLAVGVSCYETTFFVLPALVVAMVLYEPEVAALGRTGAQLRRRYIRRNLALAAGYVVVAVAYWGYFFSKPYSDEIPAKGTIGSTIRFSYYAVFESYLPGLIGRQIKATTPASTRVLTVLLGLAVLIAVVVVCALIWRRTWRAWCVFVAVLLPHVAFVGLARSGIAGPEYGREIRYFGDISWLLPVVLLLAAAGPRRELGRQPSWIRLHGLKLIAGLVAVVAVANATSARAEFRSSAGWQSSSFIETLNRSMDAAGSNFTGVFDVAVPCCIHIPQQYPYNLISKSFGLYDPRLEVSTNPSHVVDDRGNLVEATFVPSKPLLGTAACSDPLAGSNLTLDFDNVTTGADEIAFVRVRWDGASGGPGTIELEVGTSGDPAGPDPEIRVDRLSGEAIVPLWQGYSAGLALRTAGLDSVCVTAVELGGPVRTTP